MSESVLFEIKVVQSGDSLKIVAADAQRAAKQTKNLTQEQKKQKKTTDALNKSKDKTNKMDKSIYQTNLSSAKGFSKQNQMLEGGGGSSGLVQAYATLAANVFAATAAFNALRRASQVQQLTQGLVVLGAEGGRNLEVIAKGFRDAAGNAIAFDQALRAVSVGASAGFDASQLEGLAEVGRAAAISLGRDVGDAIDRLTRGAAKLEPEILDELGIFVRLDDASAKYAASLGVAASELTRFQQRQAFANEILDQGIRKFGAVNAEVEASPFDKLAATLADLARKTTDVFNTLLGPIAGLLAENTMLLAGLFAVVTKGIITTALPVLSEFSKKASAAAADALGMAKAQAAATKTQIDSSVKQLKPLKFVKGGYQDLFATIKSGKFDVDILRQAENKLAVSIAKRQKNILSGAVQNKKLAEDRIKLMLREQRELQKLISLESARTKKLGGEQVAAAGATFSGREGRIFSQLDASLATASGPGEQLKAFNKAALKARVTTRRFGKDIDGTTKSLMGMSVVMGKGMLGKALKSATVGIKGFGLAARLSIKGIFTAIPVIGQLLIVIDLIIIGFKKFAKAIGAIIPEASELAKSQERLNDLQESYADIVERSSEAGKNQAQQLISQGNATDQLVTAMNDLTAKQKEAEENMSEVSQAFDVFGGVGAAALGFLKRKFDDVFLGIGILIVGIGTTVMTILVTPLQLAANLMIRAANLLKRMQGEEDFIPLIEPIDDVLTKGQEIIDGLNKRMAQNETQATFKFFGGANDGQEEIDTFKSIMRAGGKAAEELQGLIGTDNINTFAEQLGDVTKIDELSTGLQELARGKNEDGTATAANIAINRMLEDGVIDQTEALELLNLSLLEGTKNTRLSGSATEELGNQFNNSGEKINKFFNTFKKKSPVGPMLGELDSMVTLINDITLGEGGENALFDQFEKAPESLRKVIDNTETIQTLSKELTALKEDENSTAEQIAAKEAEIGRERKISTQATRDLVRSLFQAQLLNATIEKSLKRQQNAIKKGAKANEAATGFAIDKQNKQQELTKERLDLELALAEKTLGADAMKLALAGEFDKLTQTELETFAHIQEKKEEIAANDEKRIEDGEKIALVAQQTLEITKMTQQALVAEAQAAADLLKTTNQRANAARGLGRGLTAKQELDAAKEAAKLAKQQAQNELDNLEEKFRLEKLILAARLKAAKVSQTEIDEIIEGLDKQLVIQRRIAQAKVDSADQNVKQVGADRITGLLTDTAGFQLGTAIEGGAADASVEGAGTQEKLEALAESTKPLRDQLIALGPEGELVATAQMGVLTMASAFDVLMTSTDKADQLAAVGAAIGAVGQIMAANSKAQIAEIDKQIEAEKRRDGKSQQSLAKIKEMEKKKDAIQRKAFEQRKKMQMAQTVVNTASGIMRAYADYDGITATALAVMIGALGAAQLAIISKQKYQGSGTTDVEAKPQSLTIGKRSSAVDVSQRATAGELNYLRGGNTTGQDLGGAGGAMGRKGYAMGFRRGYADGGVVVGERGPEIVTPSSNADIIPNFALGGNETNVNFTIQAMDASGVEDVLSNQRGNIIRMIREAANENGERFLETVDTQTYGSST